MLPGLRCLLAVLWCVVAGFAHAANGSTAGVTPNVERQILVMLHVPPPHFRPEGNYSGGYADRTGHNARQQVANALAATFKLQIIDDWPMPALGVDCFVMQAPPGVPLDPLVERVALDARVEWVQGMHVFHMLAHDDPLYPLQPTADAWRLSDLHKVARGAGVRVAVVDSGVETDHPDLAGRITLARNFVDAGDGVAEMHGTAVAGIIGARADDGIGIAGVAPQAVLLALRACWQAPTGGNQASCSSFTLAKALQFALDQDARVINLSLGGPQDRLLARLLGVAAARDVAVVAARDPLAADGGFPASLPGVLAVAADDGHDLSPNALCAPAHDLPATLPGRRWGLVSGSSFATAEVSGLVALLLGINPQLTPAQLRATLAESAMNVSSRDHGKIVDACAAVAKTLGACACGCAMAQGSPPAPAR